MKLMQPELNAVVLASELPSLNVLLLLSLETWDHMRFQVLYEAVDVDLTSLASAPGFLYIQLPFPLRRLLL